METIKGNPFKFLDSFTKEDKDIFFGRDKEIEEIYSRVFQSNLLLVYGASGTGKTSLIQCGLANKFNDSDWLPVLIRRGGNIISSIRNQLAHLAITPLKENTTLKKSVQSLYLDHFKPVYLIFDQFEELFIFGSAEEIREFVTEVTKIVKSDLQCKFIFVIRGEYLEHLTAFEEELPEFFNNRIRIEKMTRHHAAEAISGPCRMAGIQVEEGFEQNFLETLSPDKSEVELTYLQVFLDKLYKKASEKNAAHPVFTNSLLQEIGKISDVLSDFLEEQIARIPDSETAVSILKSFVSMEGTKRQIDLDEIEIFLKTLGKSVTRAQIELLVHQFVDLRILRDKDESGKYELRHDSLAIRIYEKITLVEKDLIEVRVLLENAYSNYLKRNILINENDLAYIAPYERNLFLNEKLQEFLENSKRAASRSKRRRMVVLFVVAGLIISVLSGFTIWAMSERSHAIDLSHEAETQKQLAERERNEALTSKDEALKANKLALEEKEKAEHNEKSAMNAKQQAEAARQQAISAMSVAEREKANAVQQSDLAHKEAKNAKDQQEIAKSEKQKAENLQKSAYKNFLLSLAQGVALKSTLYKDDPQFQGLLALQAFQLNIQNGGNQEDPIIYDALRKASAAFNRGNYPSITTGGEVRLLFSKADTLFTGSRSGALGSRLLSNLSGPVNYFARVNSAKSPIDELYLVPGEHQLITSHLNFHILLWDLNPKNFANPTYQELTGHRGLVRGIGFSPDGSHFATGGKDSLLIIWKMEKGKASLEKTMKVSGTVKTILFVDNNTLYTLLENGQISILDVRTGTFSPFAYKGNGKPTCMAYNPQRKQMVLGLSNGNLWIGDGAGTKIMETKAHTARVDMIIFDPEYKLIATAGSDRAVKIFEVANPEESPREIKDLNAKARTILFTAEHTLVISCSDKKTYVRDVESEALAKKVSVQLKRNLTKTEWKTFFRDIPYSKTKQELPE